jgi:hypothetical protein
MCLSRVSSCRVHCTIACKKGAAGQEPVKLAPLFEPRFSEISK